MQRRQGKASVRTGELNAASTPTYPAQLLLTAPEAARLLAISPRTLWTLTAGGDIQPIRVGRLVRYAVADLEAFIARQRRLSAEAGRN